MVYFAQKPTVLASIISLLLCFNSVFAAFAITGVPGPIYPRRDIRSLSTSYREQWSLYVQALTQFKATPQNELLSYYQILGVHGVPVVAWDGVKRTSSGTGYCNHGINLFPTWHRPFIALFEQRLSNHAKIIANKYTGSRRAVFQKAAKELRSAWWEWAADPPPGEPAMPHVLTDQTVSIETPSGEKTVPNPFYRYEYHPLQSEYYASPWNHYPHTLRWPTSSASNAQSQDNLAVATVGRNRPGQKANLYRFFTNCKKFLEISNDRVENHSPGCTISLESLHNNIHVWTGGTVVPQGHMTVIPYSSHDPTFMLHHTMIDRLFAMWQQLYPSAQYCPSQVSQVNTFVIRKGSVQGANSPLKPFHRNAAGQFWTSAQVRNWRVFHYTYPEFLSGGNSPAGMRAIVNRKYGPNSRAQKRDLDGLIPKLTASNSSSFEYIANIATTRYQLNGTYTIYMFFQEPTNPDPATWAYDPNLVGSYGVFSAPNQVDNDQITTSSIVLTDALTSHVQNGILDDLTEPVVVPFMTENLKWYVIGPDGSELNPDNVPNFEVSVVATTLPPITNEQEFPNWSEFIPLPEVTSGKRGGVRGFLHHLLGNANGNGNGNGTGVIGGLLGDDNNGGLLSDPNLPPIM